MNHLVSLFALMFAAAALAQQPQKKPFSQQSTSAVDYRNQNGSEGVEIRNVVYEIVGPRISGRPNNERLLLRKTTHTKQVLDEIGIDGSTTVEAWPLGIDPKEKPLYSVTVPGIDPVTMNGEILLISRGLEETQWWSAYKLGTGQPLFDTYTPIAQSSISRDTVTLRYAGLEVPLDNVADRRLKAPNVIAILIYASEERVIREALVTSDDPKLAQLLRSLADSTRAVTFDGSRIRITISQNSPSPPKTITLDVPVTRDDLDLARAQTPAGIHIAAWKR